MTRLQEASTPPPNDGSSSREKTDTHADAEFSNVHKEVLGLMGWFYLTNGKFNLAVNLLTALHRIDPHNLSAIKMLCYAWLRLGDYAKAHFYCDLLQNLSPGPEEIIAANLLKSRALWGSGHREKANELMRQVIADRKESRNVVN